MTGCRLGPVLALTFTFLPTEAGTQMPLRVILSLNVSEPNLDTGKEHKDVNGQRKLVFSEIAVMKLPQVRVLSAGVFIYAGGNIMNTNGHDHQ